MSGSSEQLRSMSSLQIALAARRARQQSADASLIAHEPIAIVGVGCRLPGEVNDLPSLWRRLVAAEPLTGPPPPDRWCAEACGCAAGGPQTSDRGGWRYGAFLDQVDTFDAEFFGIAPREAASIDPQQRLLLEVVWEALERAGLASPELMGSPTGVFIGASTDDYAQFELHAPAAEHVTPYALSGTSLNVLAGRISYWLGLHGPSMVIDTACSSSLVAVHLGCQSLRWNECSMAIVGGVNLMLTPDVSVAMDRVGVLAPDARARVFDASADGYVRAEGCAAIVLKRLSDAVIQGDPVLAVIRGTAVNQDGRSAGLTAPSQASQADVVRQALRHAALAPDDIDSIEAHATGIALSDLVEANAIESVFGNPRRASEHPLFVTSSKGTFGHSEAASGVIGIAKIIAALQHEAVPPLANLDRLHPHLTSALERGLRFPRQPQPWPRGTRLRRAGVSAFGFTGTNAHAVVEEPPPIVAATPATPPAERSAHVLTLRAKNETALRTLAARFAQRLETLPADRLADACFTANTGRMPLPYRLAIVGCDTGQIADRLRAFAAGRSVAGASFGVAPRQAPRLVLRFTGCLASHGCLDGLARFLDATNAAFHQAVNRCIDAGRSFGLASPAFRRIDTPRADSPDASVSMSASAALASGSSDLDKSEKAANVAHHRAGCDHQKPLSNSSAATDRDAPAQGAWNAFVVSFSLASALQSWGVSADRVDGDGRLGRLIAGCWAGAIPLDQAAWLLAEHPALWTATAEPTPASAPLPAPLPERLADWLQPAAWQPPHIELRGLDSESLQRLTPSQRAATLLGWCLNEGPTPLTPPQPQSSAAARGAPLPVVVSIGTPQRPPSLQPAPSAARAANVGSGHESPPPDELPTVSLLDANHADAEALCAQVGRLFTWGVPIDWRAFDGPFARQRVELPTYPFQRRRYWVGGFADTNAEAVTTTISRFDASPVDSKDGRDAQPPAHRRTINPAMPAPGEGAPASGLDIPQPNPASPNRSGSWLAWYRESLANSFSVSPNENGPAAAWYLLADEPHASLAARLAEHLALHGHRATVVDAGASSPAATEATATEPATGTPPAVRHNPPDDRSHHSSGNRKSHGEATSAPADSAVAAPEESKNLSSLSCGGLAIPLSRPDCLNRVRHVARDAIGDASVLTTAGGSFDRGPSAQPDARLGLPTVEGTPDAARSTNRPNEAARPGNPPVRIVWFASSSVASTESNPISQLPRSASPSLARAVEPWALTWIDRVCATAPEGTVPLWIVTQGAVATVEDASRCPDAVASRLPSLWQSLESMRPTLGRATWIDIDPTPAADDLDLLLDELLHAAAQRSEANTTNTTLPPTLSSATTLPPMSQPHYIAYRDAARFVGCKLTTAATPAEHSPPGPLRFVTPAQSQSVASATSTARNESPIAQPSIANDRAGQDALHRFEQQVAACVALVLGRGADEPIDPDAPLGELGLDSLMAVRLVKDLGQLVGRALPSDLLNRHDTTAALVAYLRSLPPDGNPQRRRS